MLTAYLPSGCKCMYKGSAGSCLRNGWYIIGRCLHFDNIAGHKNADSFKAAPGIVRCFGRIRVPVSLCPPFTLESSSFSLFSDPPVFQLPTRLPFSVPAQTTTQLHPRRSPSHYPRFVHRLLIPASTSSRPRDSLADPTNLPSISWLSFLPRQRQPDSSFVRFPAFVLSRRPVYSHSSRCVARKLLPAFPMTSLSLVLFLKISPFLQIHWSVDQRLLTITILGIICIKTN